MHKVHIDFSRALRHFGKQKTFQLEPTKATCGILLKIGSIVIDCSDFDKMLAFWQEALHYVPREPGKGGWVVLRDPEGRGPNISLNLNLKKRIGRNRLHLDLYTSNREGEIERLLKLGATRHRQRYETGDDFRVLEDPDGNLFCVVQKAEAP